MAITYESETRKHVFRGLYTYGNLKLYHNCYTAEGAQHTVFSFTLTSSSITRARNCKMARRKQSRVDNGNLCSTSPACPVPFIRQFWKAGVYKDELTPKSKTQSIMHGSSYIHIHPQFLHSNATSHKWVFGGMLSFTHLYKGSVAELIDNAVDEIQHGATVVIIDKILNPRNGSPALRIQDDGRGMDPEAMRRCLSFGFSDKSSISSIGKYGNGFKTSSMRLGADVIVFSRNQTSRRTTRSIGLLSYTYLTRMGYDRVVVPMVHYEFNTVTKSFDLQSNSDESSDLNLSMMLKWSPYSTEKELLKQFEDLGPHGTKVIVYNLWLNEDGNMELDFESDPEDIRITRDAHGETKGSSRLAESEQHIANQLRYSLRAYLSVLYLKLPKTFAMVLRGKVVLYRNVATELKYTEFIKYKPQSVSSVEDSVITTIGFLKEAPNVNIHGFNIYHKNRLILPFCPVVSFSNNRGRGVVGKNNRCLLGSQFQGNELVSNNVHGSLDHHCGLIGYQFKRKDRPSATSFPNFVHHHGKEPPALSRKSPAGGFTSNTPKITTITSRAEFFSNPSTKPIEPSFPTGVQEEAANLKRKSTDQLPTFESNAQMEVDPKKGSDTPVLICDQEYSFAMDENKRLRSECNDYQKAHEQLTLRGKCLREHFVSLSICWQVTHLKMELEAAQAEYARMLGELQNLEKVNGETSVNLI
ncbi:hypothetical protein OSB04_004798 [Centaurea solstitialis]|uniref:Morc S5 domain-containing protein n=1 Tax=Centaurea solstitialis TaxID=347529 RepID=A0AA38TMC0_9ASTR|nr:hypothetical protein OSB04_004798 [Centaurea solstitialis]